MPNPYRPAKRRVVDVPPSPTLELDPTSGAEYRQDIPQAPTSGSEVPAGNIREVLEWVGKSKSRAKQAVAAEKASDDPRQTLFNRLKKILDA